MAAVARAAWPYWCWPWRSGGGGGDEDPGGAALPVAGGRDGAGADDPPRGEPVRLLPALGARAAHGALLARHRHQVLGSFPAAPRQVLRQQEEGALPG